MSGVAALRRVLVLRGAPLHTSAREISRLLAVPYLWSVQPRGSSSLSGSEYGIDTGRSSPGMSFPGETRGGVSTLWQQLQRQPKTQAVQQSPGTLQAFAEAAPQSAQAQPQPHPQPVSEEEKIRLKTQVTFDSCWRRLHDKYKDTWQTPKEIVWLNGAPGSGKGANTPFILDSRGLNRAVTMSSLLERHEGCQALMQAGELVPDAMVGDALLDVIFDPEEADGVGLIIDGFPRTALQVEFLKLLYDRMVAVHGQHVGTPHEWRFPRPSFKVVVLYVDQEESVRRQCMRAQLASVHNRRVQDAGTGDLLQLRATDADVVKCRHRYSIFKQHYGTLLRLKNYFPFSLIDACGTLEQCRAQIARELRYQSSLDLGQETYAAIRHLPLAGELVKKSRQQLVQHLDDYCDHHNTLFKQVLRVIDEEAVPLLRRCSLSGNADLLTHNALFSQQPLAVDMLIDILTDRGFFVAHVAEEQVHPVSVDLGTGAIQSTIKMLHHFKITFAGAAVRNVTPGPTQTTDSNDRARLAITHIPAFLDRKQGPVDPRRSPGSMNINLRGDTQHVAAPPSVSPSQSFPGKTPEESAAQLKWEQHFSDQQKEQASKPDKGAEAAAYAPPTAPSPHP